jgi:hypothetical protein
MGTARVERISLLAVGALVGVAALGLVRGVPRAADAAQAAAAPASSEVSELRSRVERLEGKAPDQSHAMADVGYHFANLWFAGEQQNWPLAEFCLDETRSHLRWAVRIIPVRKTPAGQDLELKGILDALESSLLADLRKTIDAHDRAQFEPAYKRTLEGCYACHKAAGKPYLRPQVPGAPPAPILNFDPAAEWPQ